MYPKALHLALSNVALSENAGKKNKRIWLIADESAPYLDMPSISFPLSYVKKVMSQDLIFRWKSSAFFPCTKDRSFIAQFF